jgi:SAM-dependent methyltransferase
MATKPDYARFQNLTFERFRELAADPQLSSIEKIGFPDAYRAGFEDKIYADLVAKVPALAAEGSVVLDIGCGCSPLVHAFIRQAQQQRQALYLVDSPEMLAHVPAADGVHQVPGRYPECDPAFDAVRGAVDAIVVYSVIQYVFVEASLAAFVDGLLGLLKPGGRVLIGDIPNASMRRRFIASDEGKRFQQAWGVTPESPEARFEISHGLMDDSVVLSVLARARAAGFHAYAVPQHPELPMANRREDILIVRP